MAQPDPRSPIDEAAVPAEQTPAPPEAIPGDAELLRQAELKAQEHHDAWLRAKADADNIRKRAQIELANAHKYAIETVALELLPVKDSLEAALSAEAVTAEAIRSGVEIT